MDLGHFQSATYTPSTHGLSLADTVRLDANHDGKQFPFTKLVCTMGPSCWDVDTIGEMMDIGMTVCRLNFSHGDHEAHGATVTRIREAAAARPDRKVAIMLDTKGPEIRTGFLSTEDKKVSFVKGQTLRLTTDYKFLGDSTCIACSYKALPKSVQPGNTILIADGSLVATVLECGEDYVNVRVENNAKIGERKNMNLPGVQVDLPVLQPKDIDDIQNFGVPQNVDFVAASFVQTAEDVQYIRQVLGESGKHVKIISKIENQAGLENFEAILAASDGIMVARGDLGMEIPPHQVFIAQKIMIKQCNMAGKPVITATQMLESMTGNPRPTRAEVSDVANAVLDGTDAVMLSGETAGGSFPIEAVTTMVNTCLQAEKMNDFETLYSTRRSQTVTVQSTMTINESMASSAVKASLESDARAIFVIGFEDETLVGYITKYSPRVPVIFATTKEALARQSTGYMKNVRAVLVSDTDENPTDACVKCLSTQFTVSPNTVAVSVERVVGASGNMSPQIRFIGL